jgi:hypothetical protein
MLFPFFRFGAFVPRFFVAARPDLPGLAALFAVLSPYDGSRS